MVGKTSTNHTVASRARLQWGWLLPIIITLLYFGQSLDGGVWLDHFALKACWSNWGQAPWTIFTYAFLHKGLWHFVVNLIIILALLSSRAMTQRKFWALFIAGALAGGIFFASFGEGAIIGASAGITALIPITLFRVIVRKYLWALALVAVIITDFITHAQLWNISFSVHVMGYIVGCLYIILYLFNQKSMKSKYQRSLVEKAKTSGYASLSHDERKSLDQLGVE